jgi:hypothetical protein
MFRGGGGGILLNPALSGTWKEEVLARVEIKTFSPILDFTNVET